MNTSITLAAALLVAASLSLSAGTMKYPEKDPAFSFTLPDGWTTTVDKKGALDCKVNGSSKFPIFSINPLKGRTTEAAITAAMPKLAKISGESAGIENLQISDIKEMTTAKNVKFLRLNATGPTSEIEMVMSILAFAPRKDTYFVIMSSALASDKTHEQAIGEIVKSITPISGGSEE